MTAVVVFTVRAEQALVDIVGFIAQDDEKAAVRLVVDLRQRVTGTLSMFPDAGVKSEKGRRSITIRRYAFVYRHDPAKGEVVVLDVFGPGMDWR